jgi:DNA polymerase I-like protein with 3'-5' exonuclease and polymerase domains
VTFVTCDFETLPIRPRPRFPPEPVGVALQPFGGQAMYYRWGHPTGNNVEKATAVGILRSLWSDPDVSLVFHNASFDLAVARDRLSLWIPQWHRLHDTMFLLFLVDPHAAKLGLKPASEEILGWPPEEQDEVFDWIYAHRKDILRDYGEPGDKITRAKSGPNTPAAWIAYAPGGLVGKYAEGDALRTTALFQHLHPLVRSRGMEAAYDRERRLLPILMQNESEGLRVDLEMLERDVPVYEQALVTVEEGMRGYLGASGLDFNNDRDVASVFQSTGAVREDSWVQTPTGQLSVSKDNLPPEAFVDPLFASAFGYRNRLVTCLTMFMQKWIEQARVNEGYIHTQWNQVRGSRGGARTGRPSMTNPNLLNVSKSFEDRSDGYVHPAALELPPLPLVRSYVLPDEDEVWLHRDFSGQEVRIFAHFEQGDLAEAYRADPRLDPHDWLKAQILETTGRELERTRVKNVTFARLYGGGAGAVQAQARTGSLQEAREIIAFHDRALPGRRILSEEIQRLVRRGEPIRTWGGRLYYVEPPKMIKGRRQTFEYKMINYLIQGSAADITKEAICRWAEGGGNSMGARFLLTVYDEINLSSTRDAVDRNMEFLREIMDGMELDVPMRSDGKVGERWGALTKVEE